MLRRLDMNLKAFLIKMTISVVAYTIGLDLFFDASLAEILSFSLALTIMSFLIVDKMILPTLGSTKSLIIDFFLAYGIVWLFGNIVLNNYLQIAWGSIISAIIVTIGEVYVHYMLRHTAAEEELIIPQSTINKLAYGMEISEENEPMNRDDYKYSNNNQNE